VAPLTFGAYGGYLLLPAEKQGILYAFSPITHTATPIKTGFAGLLESVVFPTVSGGRVCTVPVTTSSGAKINASMVDAFYPTGVAYYDVSGLGNVGLVSSELDPSYIQTISPTGMLAPFDSPGSQQEHMITLTPRTDTPSCKIGGACALTLGAYRNHFDSLVLNFPPGGLTLGTQFYTNTQLSAILQNTAVGGNGLIALAHQLITAQLNLYYGALPPQPFASQVTQAVLAANTLIGNLVIPPIGTGFLSPSVTGDLTNQLDAYNSWQAGTCSQ
jgi:hypothetical protein